MKKKMNLVAVGLVAGALLLSACGDTAENGKVNEENASANAAAPNSSYSFEVDPVDYTPIEPHKDLNQEPVPVKMERVGENEVNIEMTTQITDIEIAPGIEYKTWNFNGEAPGPLLVVQEGDWINFTLHNLDPAIPHSMDFHAVHTDPTIGFADVKPNETGTFRFQASSPGVFMYHCATDPVLSHIANGMHGAIIVMPKDGYPTDNEVDREFVILQNEWYKYNDLTNMMNMPPRQVVFSAKTLEYLDDNEFDGYTFDGTNSNGTVTALTENDPDTVLYAKPGEKIRMYINNLGPNEVSSFHVIGSIMEDVYLDGNPYNHLEGMQTVMLPASGGAVVEFTLKEAGSYSFVTHQFDHVSKGAVGTIVVNESGGPEGGSMMSH
ncbi:multicopper oxidase domain-containing protein [Oceanobacillus sp. CAU 1775]